MAIGDPIPTSNSDHGLYIHIVYFLILIVVDIALWVYRYYYNSSFKKNDSFYNKARVKWRMTLSFITWLAGGLIILLIFLELGDWLEWLDFIRNRKEGPPGCAGTAFGTCWFTHNGAYTYESTSSLNNFISKFYFPFFLIVGPIWNFLLAIYLTVPHLYPYETTKSNKRGPRKFRLPGRNGVILVYAFIYLISTGLFIYAAIKSVTYSGISNDGFILWMGLAPSVSFLAIVTIWALLLFLPIFLFGYVHIADHFFGAFWIIFIFSALKTGSFFSAFSIIIFFAIIPLLYSIQKIGKDKNEDDRKQKFSKDIKGKLKHTDYARSIRGDTSVKGYSN